MGTITTIKTYLSPVARVKALVDMKRFSCQAARRVYGGRR
jgi:hypothetical protein